MALPASTANWHWKTKHVTGWAREWFERELATLRVAGDGGAEVRVEAVTEVDGDVEVGQRKSKLITIYDCRVALRWAGTAGDGAAAAGTLAIPEVSHENTVDGLSGYTYEWTLSTAGSAAADALYALARARLPAALEAKLGEFPGALIAAHGKDLTVSGEASPAGTPKAATPRAGTPKPAAAAAAAAAKTSAVNTATVAVEAQFQAAADDLFGLLTDERRIPHWSRAAAQSQGAVGTAYALFGGGVRGTYTALTPPREIVQTWALDSPAWPAGHVATLTTTLAQGADSTRVVFSLAGVPKGLESETRRNLEGYYVGGLKSIGYVQLVPVPRVLSSSSPPSLSLSPSPSPSRSSLLLWTVVGVACALGAYRLGSVL